MKVCTDRVSPTCHSAQEAERGQEWLWFGGIEEVGSSVLDGELQEKRHGNLAPSLWSADVAGQPLRLTGLQPRVASFPLEQGNGSILSSFFFFFQNV